MRYFFTLLSVLLIASCATLTNDIEVKTQSNPDVDLSSYKSYAWAGSTQIVFDPIGQWEQPTLDTDEEVKFHINRELRNRGFLEVQTDPDLLVVFAAGVDMTTLELKEDPNAKKQVLVNAPKAALIVALVDASTGYTVWLGFAEGRVQKQQTIENIQKRIDYAISTMFKSF